MSPVDAVAFTADEPRLVTPRLVMRRWRVDDLEPFAAINADPTVTATLGSALDRTASDRLAARIEAGFETYGFGLWAVEVRATATFIGFVGLSVPTFEAPCTPCVEVGWRLASAHWGHGYATEAARVAIGFGFEVCGLGEIVSFTAVTNDRSRAVMQRLGMVHDPDGDFDHPSLGSDHPLRPHVVYRLRSATS